MKFLLDENLPRSAALQLKKLGIDAEHSSNVGLRGSSDKQIAEYSKRQKAILITKDLEFGSLIFYSKDAHQGVLVVRLPNYFRSDKIIEHLTTFLTQFKYSDLMSKVTVLELGRYRMRIIS